MSLASGPDAVVVGGGPAGLASAIFLAREGLSVQLVEKAAFPRDKACGEGVLPTGVAILRELNVNVAACRPIRGIRYRTRAGHELCAWFREGPGRAIRRTDLSQALLAEARGLPNLEIVTRKLTGLPTDARLVVGADGLASQVRRWAGLDIPCQSHRWGARRHYTITAGQEVEVHLGPGVEAYLTPLSAEHAGLALLWDARRWQGPDLYARMLREFRLSLGEPLTEVKGSGPFLRRASSPVAPGVALVGDAAGYLDALTGEGISLALQQARALGKTLGGALKRHRRLPDEAYRAYARQVRRIQAPYWRVTSMVLWLGARPALAERVIRAMGPHPQLFSALLSMSMGTRPLWALPPLPTARFLRDLAFQVFASQDANISR